MSQALSSLPRPVLIVLVGVAAVIALMFATRRGTEQTSSPPAAKTPSSAKTQSQSATPARKPAPPAEKPATASVGQLPPTVERAIAAKKVVALLFWNPRGADDQAVRHALSGISTRGGKVVKYADTLGHLARYTRITGTQAVTQTPTVVVVGRNGKGRTSTGFQDTDTLEQLVVDSLK